MIELLFGSFIAGLLLTFTPCVLPMVPIISSIIVGQGTNISTKKAVMLSLAYVLGTALTYTLMGALAGATGEQLQSYFQNPWIIAGMSFIFVLMAFSMFGLFTVQVPSFIQSKLNSQSKGLEGSSLPMVFLLGMVSALILGACVSPILISFLSIAIAQGDAVLGAGMMFSMAMGMGVPLIVLGFGAGKLLPKAGAWMEKVKYLFGILLMIVAIQLFSGLNLVSELLLWGVFIIILAVYFGAIDIYKEYNHFEKVLKALGVLLLIWGTILLVGFAQGSTSLYEPLKSSTQHSAQAVEHKGPFTNIASMYELDIKKKEALENGKTLIIYFYNDYCSMCNKLAATTYEDNNVIEVLAESYIALKVNTTDKSDEKIVELKKHFGIYGSPSFVFFDSEGEKVSDEALYGYQGPEDFYDTLDLYLE